MSIMQNVLPKTGTLLVSLFDIVLNWIENYRKDAHDDAIKELVKSINERTKKKDDKWELGVITPVVGCLSKDQTKANLAAGFCRVEASMQVALADVVRDYNKTFEYKDGDEGFVHLDGNPGKGSPNTMLRHAHRLRIREQGGEWMTKFDDALKQHLIQVNLRDYGDPDTDEAKKEALADNFIENTVRTDPSLWDEMSRVIKLKELGYTGKDIGQKLSISAPAVSYYTKIHNLPDEMREYFKGEALEKAWPNPEDRTLAMLCLEVSLGEFNRRMRLKAKDDCVIDISKARELCYNVAADKVSMKDALELLKLVTCVTDDGKPQPEKSTPDLATLTAKIRSAKAFLKAPPKVEHTKEEAGAAVDAALAEGTKLLHEQQAAPVSTGNADAPAPATAPAPAAAPAPVAAPPAVNTDVPVQSAPVQSQDPDIEAQLRTANQEFSETELEPSMELDEIISAGGADILAQAKEIAAETKSNTVDPSGQMKTSMTSTSVDTNKYKPRDPALIERWALGDLASVMVSDMATSPSILTSIASSVVLLDAIGMENEKNKLNRLFIDYLDANEKYLAALEEATATAPDEVKANLMAMKPRITIADLPDFLQARLKK